MRAWGETIALGFGLGIAVVVLVTWTGMRGTPVDAWCYYGMDPANPYDPTGCFLYSPPVAQFMTVIQPLVSFDAFFTILRTLETIALAVISGPAIGVLLVIPAVAIELNAANINILLVGAVLLGFRYPATWAFVILTKLTPGVGLLWFAVRREWRGFGIAAGLTIAIAVLSFALAPRMWHDYVGALAGAPDETPFKIWWRLPIAALVVIWGARSNHRWAMIVAVFLAMPRWYFLSPVILVGLFPLVRLPRPLPTPPLALQWPLRPTRASKPLPSSGKTATSIGSAVS
jgi:glycosyl transferase family 87